MVFTMFGQKNIKKIISIIIACILFFNSTHLVSEYENKNSRTRTNYNWAQETAYGYGTFLATSLFHEFGHWIVGKKIHNCNGVFWVTPLGTGNACLYQNPTKDVLKSLLKNDLHYPIKHAPLNPFVSLAGPLFGIGASLFAPLLNTFYHEYKQDKSMLNAAKRTMQQPYINDKQNLGLLVGAQCSLLSNLLNLSPFIKGSDGNKIAKYFNIACGPSKLARAATAIAAATLVYPTFTKVLGHSNLFK